ncbi:hypothetical protein [Ekhidna sp. To15]|uniref:hypothetical protein n=1 Tax=Ekhidna sp. To15 TaxID=3395267 RepID=UPI003F51E19A
MNRSLTLITLLLPIVLLAQPQVEAPYEKAYNEISAMLDGEIDYSFKRAVFTSENAFFNNTQDYDAFQQQIEILSGIANYVAQNGTLEYDYPDRDKIAKYWGTFMTLKHPLSIPLDSSMVYESTPFEYDFEDFNGDQDWTKMFVTKALFTNSGNCHSLPFLYKIIVEELGEEAWLAMAPNHTYIKHRSMQNGMYNTELTTGHFPTDSWIMASGYIKLDAVVNAVYMDTLSQKESVAVTLVDLAQGYQKKYGEDHNQEFVLECLDKALEYYPHYVNALILKAEIHKNQYEQKMDQYGADSPSDLWNDPTLKAQFDQIQAQYAHIHKLGYRKMPDDMYINWLLDVEERDQDDKSERTTFEAPQPFEDYGYKVKTLTLSKGKYQEFFDQEETTEIGSVVFNRMSNSITHFITYDTVRSEATLEPEVISRWMSPDPLADERLNVSPYNFVQNNPINRIDPDGMLDDLIAKKDGSIEIIKTDDDFDRFFVENKDGSTKQVAQLDKVKSADGSADLVKFPERGEGFTRYGDEEPGGDRYVQPTTAAALFGAINEITENNPGTTVQLGNMSSESGGKPGKGVHKGGSLSHVNGRNVDVRYSRSDGTLRPVTVFDSQFDRRGSQSMVNSFNKFGFKSILSHTTKDGFLMKNTKDVDMRLYGVPTHHNHLHLQGFSPKVIIKK